MLKKTPRCFLCVYCFLILPFGSFSKPFIYTFHIKIRYPPTYLEPLLPLSGRASCRVCYYHRELPGRSAGVNFPKVFASPRETDIFSYVSPGAERCLFTHPWTGQKKSWLTIVLRLAHPRGPRGHTDNADRWLCVSLSNKAQFWKLGSIDHRNDKLYWPIFRSATQTFNGG